MLFFLHNKNRVYHLKGVFTIETLDEIRNKKGFICDMDGVIYHGNKLLPGVKEFVDWLYREDKKFLFLTNSSDRSPRDLMQKLQRMGLDIDETHFYTSAQATAREEGITMNDTTPDYVVIGEPKSYNYEMIIKAVKLIQNGAKLVATNSDLTGPTENGIIPACRAFVAPIELATGKNAYFVGKPNPLMMRTGLRMLGVHSDEAAMIGDRMDTDIVAGMESGLETVLVLSGVTTRENMQVFAYRPRHILNGVGDIVPKE